MFNFALCPEYLFVAGEWGRIIGLCLHGLYTSTERNTVSERTREEIKCCKEKGWGGPVLRKKTVFAKKYIRVVEAKR